MSVVSLTGRSRIKRHKQDPAEMAKKGLRFSGEDPNVFLFFKDEAVLSTLPTFTSMWAKKHLVQLCQSVMG